ncbi:MAG: hypothetical protein NTV48_01180 [Candidatus Vogelbacteria bacterium]|nr:hypothetical protein [Candidatus Vogelbacteria bacterium]
MTTAIVGSMQTSLEKAQGMYWRRTDCFGPQELRQIGIEVVEVPPVPLSEKMLAHLRTLGVSLEWHEPETAQGLHDRLGNKLGEGKLLYKVDWYGGDPIYTEEKSAVAHWRVVTKNIVPDSTSHKYLPQTRVLAEYLKGKVFAGQSLPEKFRRAIEEINDREKELSELVERDWNRGGEQVVKLAVNQLCRGTAEQSLYGIALHGQVNKEYLLTGLWDWTKSRSSDGYLVDVGHADEHGVGVDGDDPGDSGSDLGVRFSCSAEDLAT